MKKTYIIPEITIHKLEVMNLLAGSPNAGLKEGNADKNGVVLSRRGYNDWDDDEEDDW